MKADAVSKVLGLRLRAPSLPMALMSEVEQGLPLAAPDRLSKAVAPDDAGFSCRMVPRATLARRRRALSAARDAAGAKPSAEDGARVARPAGIWALAREVWGSDEDARGFLFASHPLLEGRRPVDVVLANELGGPLVEGVLGRLQYGSAV